MMDPSESKIGDAEINRLFGVYLQIENLSYPSKISPNKSVIKYTRIPDLDRNCRVSWPQKNYALTPRFRRIIMIEEPKDETRRSLKSEIAIPSSTVSSNICKRKVVTIDQDDYSLHPKFSQNEKKSPYTNVKNQAIETEIKEQKHSLQRKVSGLSNSSISYREIKPTTKINTVHKKKDVVGAKFVSMHTKYNNEIQDYNKNIRLNESSRAQKNTNSSPKYSSIKKSITTREIEKEISVTKNKPIDSLHKTSPKRPEKTKARKSPSNLSILNGIKAQNKPTSVILVPLDGKHDVATETSAEIQSFIGSRITQITKSTAESSAQVINYVSFKDMNIGTDVSPNTKDQVTEIDDDVLNRDSVNNKIKETFDSLDIPNVSLMNSRSDIKDVPKEKIVEIISKDHSIVSEPTNRSSKIREQKVIESHFHKSTSYIISRATLTCTTSQKIDFHVVESDEVLQSQLSRKPYPMNVVSVFKQEINNRRYDKEDDTKPKEKHLNDMTTINCPFSIGHDSLVKPSDIINTINVKNSIIHCDYISEQFQRELNFIDSFFESLQYLENCSLSEKSIAEKKVDNFMNSGRHELNNLEIGSFLSKFEENINDSSTMASKSLCLLNLLIRDEQRRAKNLLFVLKMREDALKDFTKSQILWLENKKKQDNIDVSTLKKKQRGALLKLQHECGEMQRMRKALITLSEKRKLAFMKTKKNIELKLNNRLDVEQIIWGKRKLRRSSSADRNVAPLKCFELSSSGCDDTITTRSKTAPIMMPNISHITSAEKFVQTGNSLIDQSTSTTDENFVVVDGGYLNILFHNVSLPRIFSGGKQYEVDQEALMNIVQASNISIFNMDNDPAIEELIDQMKDLDRSSTPSTARSLLDEFDQIYKCLAEEEITNCPSDPLKNKSEKTTDVVDQRFQQEESDKIKEFDEILAIDQGNGSNEVFMVDESCTCDPSMVSGATQSSKGKEVSMSVSGPLPIPAGAAAVNEEGTDAPTWLTIGSLPSLPDESSSASSSCQAVCPSVSSLTSPVQYEAEELRRQQLAIEREIKALEQQQCQLLAVREIPDKPPPPYTPPSEPKPPKQPRNFCVDGIAKEKIRQIISNPKTNVADTDPFDIFVEDFCRDAMQRQNIEKSEKYWDTCNMLPPKTPPDTEQFINKTVTDLKEVLTSVPATVVSGVGARRSDHIDDILFAEWRRCEPEWTSLHADDIIVKNQVFESIFQKILTSTIDEYKKTVIAPSENN